MILNGIVPDVLIVIDNIFKKMSVLSY